MRQTAPHSLGVSGFTELLPDFEKREVSSKTACVFGAIVIQPPVLAEAQRDGKKQGPLPDCRSIAASTVTVHPESITSSTSSTGASLTTSGTAKNPIQIPALVKSILLVLLRVVSPALSE